MKRAALFFLFSLSVGACESGGAMREAASPRDADEAKEAHEHKKPIEPIEPGRKFEAGERWTLSDPTAVKALRDTAFGEQEIVEFWTRKGWRLTRKEERYMDTVDLLAKEGRIKKTAHWSQTPFNAVYEAQQPLDIAGTHIEAGTEFWMEFCENEDEVHLGTPIFTRTNGYQEEHQGHVDQASDLRNGELRAGRERH